MPAGSLYQTHLRAELTRRLGASYPPVTKGYADISGVPRKLIDAFRLRREEIVGTIREPDQL